MIVELLSASAGRILEQDINDKIILLAAEEDQAA
jgi:hypothetical protein